MLIALVGEQLGNEAGLRDQPFAGPIGRVLDRALAAAGLGHDDVHYVSEVGDRPLEPVVVCLGQTAASDVFGHAVTVRETTGRVHTGLERAPGAVLVTHHPSAVLRALGRDEARLIEAQLVAALAEAKQVARALEPVAPGIQ